ncbi:hypothetical protein [Gimesia aquarii]|uniref:Uncharacterized protein n=1 Tax=Gimesia aquarii TaxID=2527964 RepID=A0A517VTI5_9PLAN|nr:hypothetical protein [Gimesia aquarii]QDT96279.1 hypothetical protein V144x_17330 [Gimesia aquarii]
MSKSCNTFLEKMQKYTDEFFEETGKTTVTTKELAVWAITTNRWEPPMDLVVKKCQEDFARAMREQHINNERGQPVRVKHVARIRSGDQQLYLWGDIRNMPQEHMEISFQQRREQIVGECKQLKRDVDFYNEQNIGAEKYQMVFDFREDIEEGEFSAEYSPVRTSIGDLNSYEVEPKHSKKVAK